MTDRQDTSKDAGAPHTISIPTVIPAGKSDADQRGRHLRERARQTLGSAARRGGAGAEQVHRSHRAILEQDPNVEILASIVYRDQMDRAGRTVFEFEQFEISERVGAGAIAGMFTTPNQKVGPERLQLVRRALIERAAADAGDKGLPYGQVYAILTDRPGAEEVLNQVIAESEFLNFDNRLSRLIEQEVLGRYEELDIPAKHVDNLLIGVGVTDPDDMLKFQRRRSSNNRYEQVMASREASSDAQRLGRALGIPPALVGHGLALPDQTRTFVAQLPKTIGRTMRLFMDGFGYWPLDRDDAA